ncbi:caspase family protein [Embleya sp. NPDC005971]|uniref:caspase family protein n=1 Tax=Embleya sp. NPDC005971 TaxID=3156724 RepID=UPI003406BDF7
MAKAAVIIGVGKYRELTHLEGALNSAREMVQWFEGEGYEVHRFIDQPLPDAPVESIRAEALRECIQSLTMRGDVEQLVIYFAGHGVVMNPQRGSDLWLLSNCVDNPNEAVEVDYYQGWAQYCGIRHVVLISDACRVLPDARFRNGLTGFNIFPNATERRGGRTFVDRFYAVELGKPAYEIPARGDLPAFGIFSRAVLDALHGRLTDALEFGENGEADDLFITTYSMWRAVEERMQSLSDELHINSQIPWFEITSFRPPCRLARRPSPAEVSITVRASRIPSAPGAFLVRDAGEREIARIDAETPSQTVRLPRKAEFGLSADGAWKLRAEDGKRRHVAKLDTEIRVAPLSGVRGADPPRDVVTRFAPPYRERTTAPHDGEFVVETMDLRTGRSVAESRWLAAGSRPPPVEKQMPAQHLGAWDIAGIMDPARDGFPDRTGLCVRFPLGRRPAEVAAYLPGGTRPTGIARPGPARWGTPARPTAAIIRTGSGGDAVWLLSAVFPDYVTLHLANDQGSDLVLHLPLGSTSGKPWVRDETEILKEYAVGVVNGWEQVATDPDSPVAEFLNDESIPPNPTLALSAAYALSRAGERAALSRLIARCAEQGWVPYDLVLLAGHPRLADTVTVTPTYPLMRAGWLTHEAPRGTPDLRPALRWVTWSSLSCDTTRPDPPELLWGSTP